MTIETNVLFDGNDNLFKKILSKTKVYGEYGCGLSTNWVLKNTQADILSVDTSKVWIESVKSTNIKFKNRLNIKLINLGEVGNWGWPLSYDFASNFNAYNDWIWRQLSSPDTVLIDGRFRVCCFLTSLKYAKKGTKIIFDDYCNRPYYHLVENYIQKEETYGRQCLFIVPDQKTINFKDLDNDIKNFRYVMD